MRKDIQNYFVHGSVLIDVDGASLNNLGIDKSTVHENTALTKSIKKGRDTYAMVSGQAWRYWWRESCAMLGWNLSPITKSKDKTYLTAANPEVYEDDDVFGYMSAKKIEKVGKDGEVEKDSKGNPKMDNATVTRVSPLKNSILVSVVPTKLFDEFCAMTRQQGEEHDPAPYGKQSYSAVMKGLFSVDLDQLGTFTSVNRSGYQNISAGQFQAIIEKEGNYQIQDKIYTHVQKARLNKQTRSKRLSETITALKTISGGAKGATNYNSVKPDFIVLAILQGGNNPFDNIAVNENGQAVLSASAINEAILDNVPYLKSPVYIGRASGFMDDFCMSTIKNDQDEFLKNSAIKIYSGSVNEMIDKFVTENADTIIKSME